MKKCLLLVCAGLLGVVWAEEFIVQVEAGTGGTVSIIKNGEAVSGSSVMAGPDDTVVVTAVAAEGKRFVQWQGARTSFAEGSYLGDASVTLHPTGPTTLTAQWVTPKTRYWNPTTMAGSYWEWKEAKNWLDEDGATGRPLVGDTVVFGSNTKSSAPHSVGEASNPLYELRFENKATVSGNQGLYALLAGGRGLQYLRQAHSGSHWCGLSLIGDGIIPVNIAENYNFVMQKSCTIGTKSGYSNTPILLKQGPGTVINCCESGNYTYTVPVTVIEEGGWDITMTKVLEGCVFKFSGTAKKKLTFCYGKYTTDLPINNGGFIVDEGAENIFIEANNKNGRVVFTGTPKFSPMVFSGRFTKGAGLVWSPTSAENVFVCSNGVSDTAGMVSVTKGVVKLVDGASFTALSELAVSDGATFEVDAASGVDFHAEALTLGGGSAKLKLASGVSLAVTAASLAGSALAPGTYAATEGAGVRKAAWIEGAGTVVVATGPGNSATWVGGDATSTLVTKGANWQDGTVPDLAAGDLFATFASGGAEARLEGTVGFDGLALNNTAGTAFTFAAESGAQATIAGNGITVADAAAATTWTMGWPLALGVAQTWNIGANNTLKIDAPFSGDVALTVDGAGTAHFNVASAHTGALDLRAGTVKATASNAFGPAGRTVTFHHNSSKLVFSGDITFDAPMWSSDQCESFTPFMTVEADSHVTFNGAWGYQSDGGITFGAGSVTTFKGGLQFKTDGMKGRLQPYGSGTIVIEGSRLSTCRSWIGQTSNPITLELRVANNQFNDNSYWAHFPAGRIVTRVANAFTTSPACKIRLADTEFDLDGNNQKVDLLATSSKTRVMSAKPATLTFLSTTTGDGTQDGNQGGENRVDSAVYSGQVSVVKSGAYPHAFGAESSTTGSVEVTAGTLTFNASGKWPNATGVKLLGGALVLQNVEAVGPNAQWDVKTGSSPVLTLGFSGILPADKLTVDGVHLKGGVYGAVDSGAEHEVAWITGDGLLKVASRGTVLIFK